MADEGSVTLWLARLKAGNRDEAVERLWGRYFGRLVGLARRHLQARHRAAADEEDVALSAFKSFVRAAQEGKFPRLTDRGDLWQVLLALTARKATDLFRAEMAEKRGGGEVVRVSEVVEDAAELHAAGKEPTPAEAAAMAEATAQLLDALDDDQLRRVAVWKLEGYTNVEIAGKLGRAVATVERKLRLIRETWEATADDSRA